VVGDGNKDQEVTGTAFGASRAARGPDGGSSLAALHPSVGPILEGLPTAVLLARGDRILAANGACARLLEAGDASLLSGRSLSGLLEGRGFDADAKQSLLLWLLDGKNVPEATSDVIGLLGPDQEPVQVRLTRKPATFGTDGVSVLSLSRLVDAPSSQNRVSGGASQEIGRLTSVGQLASGAAQAVNNPLAYIATNVTYASERLKYISALLDDSSSMQVSDPRTLRGLLLPVLEALGEARVGAGRASQLIKDLRSLIEHDTALSAVDVRTTLESAVNMAEAEVSLRAHLRAELEADGFVQANSTRLTQLFLSLIVGRAQALPSGSPQRYRIDVRSLTEDDWFVFSIGDNAKSVELNPTGATSTGGSEPPRSTEERQLALTMCRYLATSLGGTLELNTSVERGTTVLVRLPLTDASRKAPPSSLKPLRPGRRTRVLIVDNEPLIVRALSRLLRADYDVETAGGGYEALELIVHESPFDLVLCDLAMPEMSGIELFREALRVAPEMGPRFVFVTGAALSEQTQTLLGGLPNRVLEKPIQPEVLRGVVEQLLGTSPTAVPGPTG
jgi:CheY-like chemotaxis protein